jgi:hypothetical protein
MARKLFGVVAAVALASGAMFALVGPVSAQTQGNTFTVQKIVSGPVPSGTVFTVQVSCTKAAGATLYFNSVGNASNSSGTPITATVFHPQLNDACTANETSTGGASSVSYACSHSGLFTSCHVDNKGVDYGDTSNGVGTVTITNTFNSTTTTTVAPAVTTTLPATTTTTLAPKPVPQPVVAPAHFTG